MNTKLMPGTLDLIGFRTKKIFIKIGTQRRKPFTLDAFVATYDAIDVRDSRQRVPRQFSLVFLYYLCFNP